MIELKDLKPGDIFTSKITASKILEVNEGSIMKLCIKGTGKGQKRSLSAGQLEFFLSWCSGSNVRRIRNEGI